MTSPARFTFRQSFVLLLLFAVAFLNYFDRQTLSVLKPILRVEIGLTDSGYSLLVSAFMAPYIVMYLLSGPILARLGARTTMSVFVALWSLATVISGLTSSRLQLALCRGAMGFAEPVSFPTSLRVYSAWFAPGLRGLVSGFCTTGSALGAMLAPPIVATVAVHFGWRASLVVPGMIGLLIALIWWMFYRDPTTIAVQEEKAGLSRAEWFELFRKRAVWGIVLAGFISTPVWFFYLFWLPAYLQEHAGLSLQQAGWVGWIPFLVADVGGVISGWASDRLIRRGEEPVAARLKVMGIVACFAPVGMLAIWAQSVATALVIFSIVAVICQCWFVNNAPLVADLFPADHAPSVQGIYGAFGALGGLLINAAVGPVVERVGYGPIFFLSGGLHILAFVILRRLLPPSRGAS